MGAVAQFSPTLAKMLEFPGVLPVIIVLTALTVFAVAVAVMEQVTGKSLGQWLGMG